MLLVLRSGLAGSYDFSGGGGSDGIYSRRAFAAPPDLPPERLQALRDAFWNTMQDKDFLADADKQVMEIFPSRGEVVQDEVIALAATPQNVIELTDKVLENQMNVFDVKLNWKVVKDAVISGVEAERIAAFTLAGQAQKADIANAKITIAGQAAKPGDLKPGMICDISYLGNNDLSREATCRMDSK